MQIKSYSKAELADLYNVSSDTFAKWIKSIEDLLPHYKRSNKVFTPKQVKVIFEELGEV
jgi:predicted DNA-binding protein YlxM (UPF0122 family)